MNHAREYWGQGYRSKILVESKLIAHRKVVQVVGDV